MKSCILLSAILMVSISAFSQTPPTKYNVFESVKTSSSTFSFYQMPSVVDAQFKMETTPGAFTLKIDDFIVPGSVVKFPPSMVFNYDRKTSTRTLVWTSTTCFPTKRVNTGNSYIKSMSCNSAQQTCDIQFTENFGDALQKAVPYTLKEDGSIDFSSKTFALALNGKIPNKSDEFKDLTSKNLRYGRIAMSNLSCTAGLDGVAKCSWSMDKEQNPFPSGRPWDDCESSF
jgi:hypothetical protein